jgi:hypothetical protein
MRSSSIVAAMIFAVVVQSPVRGQNAARGGLSPGTTIGVVSLLPDELHLTYEAPTVFGNWHHMAEVPGWAIDEFTAKATAAILRRLYPYQFEALTVGPVGSTLNPVFVAAEQRGFDTVVIIDRRENPRPDDYEGGVGLLDRKEFWIEPRGSICAFSWLVIEVWDVASRDRVEKQEALHCERDKNINLRESYADYSDAEKAQIEVLVKTSLFRSAEAAVSDFEVFQQ